MTRLENTILKETAKACKVLKIKPIRVKFNNKGLVGFAINTENWHRHITMEIYTLLVDTKINNTLYLFQMFKLNSISKRIKFVVYHEVAHYFQFIKHKKWFIRELEKDRIYDYMPISSHAYRNLKAEKQADRIAMYLVNKGI